MITFVYGAPGSGKTHYVFDCLKQNHSDSYLIVPEQLTVTAERAALDALPPKAQLDFEVLNFSRLGNKVFRRYGGLSYHYITPAMKSLMMWRTLRELAPILNEYGMAGGELSITELMLSAADELNNSAISPTALESTAKKLPDGRLKSKLMDLSLICAAYSNLVSSSFDDKADDLKKLSELLSKHRFFAGCRVYIDSFSSFTAAEYSVIRHIFEQTEHVTVTLACEAPSCGHICCESAVKAAQKLNAIAAELNKKTENVFLTGNFRAKNSELAELATELWKTGHVPPLSTVIPESGRKNLRLIACRDAYDQAAAAVSCVMRELQNGLRYREIAIVARDAEKYDGIIDAALEASSIPYFMSKKTELSVAPAITLILSALRIKYLGFRSEDILTHVKTGIYNIPNRDIDMFEEYIYTWGIAGSRFTDSPWSMNPDGYTDRLTKRGERILSAANSVRELLLSKLERFFAELDTAENVRDMCSAIYNYMQSSGLPESLTAAAEAELARDDRRAAYDTLAIYNIMIALLDDLNTALGDEKLGIDELYRAWLLCVKNAEIGAIPTGYDEVTVGSASLLRTDGIKAAIIIGLNEGEFPANIKDTGVFTDTDRTSLLSLGLEIGADSASRSAEEMLYARRALTLPSERLYLLYAMSGTDGSKLRPSMLVNRILRRYDYLKPECFAENDPFDAVYTQSSALDRLPLLLGTKHGDAISSVLGENKLPTISEAHHSVSSTTADSFFGSSIALSQSKIDKFVSCRFAYYCENVLKLRCDSPAQVDYSVSGSFIHSVLERFMRRAVSEDGIKDGEPEKAVDEVINELLCDICSDEQRNSNRLKHLFLRLRRLSLLLISSLRHELSASSFVPSFFELKIGDNGIEPLKITLNDGSCVLLGGIIDRVDLWRDGEKVYVRVVDYKTGAKKFSLSDIESGLNLQLIIYLFTLCGSKGFAKLCSVEPSALLLPAGANYLSSHISIKSYPELPETEKILEDAERSLDRSGFYLKDEGVISALGLDNARPNALDVDSIYELKQELEATVCRIAEVMKSGNADASPFITDHSPCEYCKMSGICRIKNSN